ncbi:MAG: DsbA family protein, partial [SAR324 cluster bacterium]|nr:DsbA family protein [SAR324 cluster bacterium]
LKKYARQIGIKNKKKFDQCLDSDRYRGLVNQDMEDGAGLGISGTPGFFIGRYDSVNRRIKGELLSGAQPLSAFENLIAKYLAKP